MKYDKLLTVMLAPDNLRAAAAAVVRNRGAAGVNGMRVDDLEAYLHENWAGIRARILAGEYHPRPVRGVEIPKPSVRLIRRYLQSGMLLGGVISPRSEGTPQGGPLSPLLSNILLDEFDRELTRRGHRFVRYADDCSIFLRSPSAARRVRASVERWLGTKLRLVVNAQKTVICRPVKFTLLGYGFVPSYRKGERGAYQLRIAATSWKRLREKMKRITRKTLPLTLAERIAGLNRLMRGWLRYFKLATGYAKLREPDGWIRNRLRYCIWKQWKRPRRRYRAFLQLGISKSWARRYAWSRKSGWRLSCSMVMKTAVPEALLRKRGYIPFVEYYHQTRASP